MSRAEGPARPDRRRDPIAPACHAIVVSAGMGGLVARDASCSLGELLNSCTDNVRLRAVLAAAPPEEGRS